MDNSKMPHFLLVGHEGSHNRGCEALVRSTAEIIRKQYPTSVFDVATLYPEHEGALSGIEYLNIIPGYTPYNINKTQTIFNQLLHLNLIQLFKYLLPHGVILKYGKNIFPYHHLPKEKPSDEKDFFKMSNLRQNIINSNAVISIGGDVFVEDYGPPLYMMEVMEYAQRLGCKTIIWGVSIWPYKVKWIENRMRDMLLNTDLITVRDDETVEYLLSLGLRDNVVRVADGAFLMEPNFTDKTALPWAVRPQTIIGFNGSDVLFGYLGQLRAKKAIQEMVVFFQKIIDDENHGLILIPHDGFPGAAERDFLFGLQQLINRPDSVYMVPVGLNAPEIKAIIGQCDYFLSMRFHPSIASLSQCVPTFGIFYSPKFAGLHGSVFGHTEYLLPIDKITHEILIEKFNKLIIDREMIREHLARRIPELQEQALRGGIYLKNILKI